jgi:4'-phosphopantetheinyl transferase
MESYLDPDTVRVRWLSIDAGCHVHVSRWRDMLDDDEQGRADRFCFAADRNIFIAARALTRTMLSDATGLPVKGWRYIEGQYGKLALGTDYAESGLRFNLTHTRGIAACAIAHDEVGIDVESSDRQMDFANANRYLAPEEALVVSAAPLEQRAAIFFRFWTLKEAFIKATGEGLSRPLASFSFAFNPVRVSFHPERDRMGRLDDPATWQFSEWRPAPERLLALAVHRVGARPSQFDAREAQAEKVGHKEADA